MGSLIPIFKKALAEVPKKESLIEIQPASEGLVIKTNSVAMNINGEKITVDPRELIRTIKHITQCIGDYTRQDNLHAKLIVPSLRKARNDAVSYLEKYFRITWRVNDKGVSEFCIMK